MYTYFILQYKIFMNTMDLLAYGCAIASRYARAARASPYGQYARALFVY